MVGTGIGQEPAVAPGEPAQPDPVTELVVAIEAAEAALSSVAMTLSTQQRMPGGFDVTTRGQLHVLRGTQPGSSRLHSRLDYAFSDGLHGQMETAQTPDGIVLFEEDPAFGAVLLRFSLAIVIDLEWAGEVLVRDDLPGMRDSRAGSPLGSGMIRGLLRSFDLAVDDRSERDGEAGTWLVGARKAGLDEQDPDLPVADRVELFVRGRDKALLAVRWFVGDDVVQSIVVAKIEVDGALPESTFVVGDRGLRPRDVELYPPMWEQIEQILRQAEAKSGEVRPSRR
jgi:hypothetical protein